MRLFKQKIWFKNVWYENLIIKGQIRNVHDSVYIECTI